MPQGAFVYKKPEAEGESAVYRSPLAKGGLVETLSGGEKTLYEVFRAALKARGNNAALSERRVVNVHKEEKEVEKTVGGETRKEKKIWSFFELSPYRSISGVDLGNIVDAFGSALAEHLPKGAQQPFNIYASTSKNWYIAAQGAITQSIPFSTAYDSLGEEGLSHSINEPEAYGLFTNADLLSTVASAAANTPTLQLVVYDGDASKKTKELDTLKAKKITVYSFDDFIALGKEKKNPHREPSPDDIACIMYTSGSSGPPKGVVLKHKNLVSTVGAIERLDLIKKNDRYLAYLPLAHILEFVVELTMLYTGATLGYGNPRTLTDASVRNSKGDLAEFRPTIMVGVPAVWETIRKGIVAKVAAGGAFKSHVFYAALSGKSLLNRTRLPGASLFDALVFNKVKQATGGNLRLTLSGAAPIAKSTQDFLNTAVAPMIQGFGMTETCAMCTLQTPAYKSTGHVGPIVPAVDLKLIDVAESGYKASNNPPQGEILLRGPSVTEGYFKREDLTKEAFTDDGWFRTGDVGQLNSDGTISIIDRRKNLVKLAGGEYVALERLETVYKSSALVAQLAVHGDSNAHRPMALVVPDIDHIRNALSDKGSQDAKLESLEELAHSKDAKDLLTSSFAQIAKEHKLKPLETLQTVVIADEAWTIENGLLTASQKLQRKKVIDRFKDDIKKVYP